MRFEKTIDGITAMDPRLQRLVAWHRRGMRKATTTSTEMDEVAVVAKVTDLAAWEGLSEVRLGSRVGAPEPDGTTIVTGRIPVARIEHVRQQPFVTSIKAARRLGPTLASTTQETLSRPALLPKGSRTKGGKGVVVGIVDFGGDFAHQNFITAAGKTRLLGIWDQTGSGKGPVGYGTLHTPEAINNALTHKDPYTALGYDPEESAHGTHVMDIAAGNGRGSGVAGMAPAADLLFVHVSSSDVPWGGPGVVGTSFGDSVQLLEALAWIFGQAAGQPCVINVSLGTNGGPHDGSTLVEQGIDRLIAQRPDRAVVIAASNSYADGIHSAGTVPAGSSLDLDWVIGPYDRTDNELELWYPGGTLLRLEIIDPDGKSQGLLAPGESGTVTDEGGILLFAANRVKDPNNGDNTIGVYLDPRAAAGIWKLRLLGDPTAPTSFHAWVERDDYGQSTFPGPQNNSFTLGSISCGHETIVAGSYDAHKPGTPLSWFSSAGPTRDGRSKPEVSAPGHDVEAARSRSTSGTTRMSGTSMAAPAVTGLVALVFGEARARGLSLTSSQLRNAIIGSVRPVPGPGGVWHARYGAGRISGNAAINSIIAGAGTHTAGASKPTTSLKTSLSPKFQPGKKK
jgi:hypothetical protein